MAILSGTEAWEIEFESDLLKYEGTATRMFAYDNVFFLVHFHLDRKPDETYSGDFYPKKKLVNTLIIIEWECHTQGIESKFAGLIGSAIEKKFNENGLSIF
jgi:hypothetical protein